VVALVVVLAAVTACARMVDGNANPESVPTAPRTATTGSPEFPASEQIGTGDCISHPGFTVVDCALPHELEVFRFDQLPASFPSTYPTPATLLPRFEPQCRAGLAGYVGSPEVDASRLREFVYWPSQQGWRAGERWVLCAAVEIGPDDRPLRRTGALGGVLRGGLGELQACSAGPPSQGTLRVVPCSTPHRGEAIPGVLVLGAPTDPPVSAEQANMVAEPHCRRATDAFLDARGGRPEVRYSWRYPLPESWPNGYTSVVCYAETATPVTGSLRNR
jgi:hypothetical protein